MQDIHHGVMDRLVRDRHELIAAQMAASRRRSEILPRIGLLLIRIGEVLRNEGSQSRPVVMQPSRPRLRPGSM